mgnify:CR=1 FL=1
MAVVLGGDHIYKMDYSAMIEFHQRRRADLTVAVMHVPLDETDRFGIMTVDDEQRVVEFTEKPKNRDKGTLASMGDQAGYRTLVLSGDRDAFQLINDDITVLYPGHHFKDLKHMTPDAVQEKYHVSPAQYPDLAALRGETADNIPGVPGVGDGFAAKWINQYGGLEQIIEHADEISGKKGEALRENIEQVKLNRSVNALVRDLDLGVSVSDLTFGQVDAGQLTDW